MQEKPILFNTEMVRALLSGRKTQTRRLIDPQPDVDAPVKKVPKYAELEKDWGKYCVTTPEGQSVLIKPKYEVGDILWVRETHQHTKILNLNQDDEYYGYVYRADDVEENWSSIKGWKWKPNIFMPKEACRIRIVVESVTLERVQDISAADIKAEGVYHTIGYYPILMDSWERLWVSVNGQESWNRNDYVWAYHFKVKELPEIAKIKNSFYA